MPAVVVPTETRRTYGPKLVGSWGEFTSPQSDHRILYLSTTVRFSSEGNVDDRLHAIRHLRPVREVLDVRQLKFKELLQRDIDDHRVAHEMVPYLLGIGDRANHATFFPPILAIFLPRAAMDGAKEIPRISVGPQHHAGMDWEVAESEDLFRLMRLAQPGGKVFSEIPLAQLEWNSQLANLVVIDGQHRLMAMLAIHRTHHNEWGDDPTYKRIYEDSVKSAIDRAGFNRDIELPLTILTFPELSGPKTEKLYPAARKIFVDVNRGAKSPTQSRLILLSDTDLSNIVVRELLETIRAEDQALGTPASGKIGGVPVALLPAIQYDASSHEDEKDKPRVTRLVKLGDLRDFSNYLAFYPQNWQRRVVVERERDRVLRMANFRDALAIEERFGNELSYEEDEVEKLVNLVDIDLYNCPLVIAEKFTDVYLARTGAQLSSLLRTVYPYASHLLSLEDVKGAVDLADMDGELVAEAIFSGSGTAFTLERIRDEYRNAPLPAAAAAWKRLADAEAKFVELYAARLFPQEPNPEAQRRRLSDLTEQTRSRACLLGLVMSSALFLNSYEEVFGRVEDESHLRKVVGLFSGALNEFLADPSLTRSKCHRVAVLSKKPVPGDDQRIAFNKIPQMSPDNWVEFRCMWWEILMYSESYLLNQLNTVHSDDARSNQNSDFKKILRRHLADARKHLLKEYVDLHKRRIKIDHPEYEEPRITNEARKVALKEYFETYVEWFGFSQSKFEKAFGASVDGKGKWKLND